MMGPAVDEIRLHPVCDLCGEARTDAVSRVVMGIATHPAAATDLTKPTFMVVDLCEDHVGQANAVAALAGRGRPLSRRAPAPRVYATGGRVGRPPVPPADLAPAGCPVCESTVARRNLVTHLVTQHGWKRPRMPKVCPDCGFKAANPQSMARHRGGRHGYSTVATMVEANT